MNKIFKNKSGNVLLELRQESASAWLTIKRTGRLVDEKDILDLIDEAGIKSGFEEAVQLIRERGIEKEFDRPFPIAVCKKVEGKREATLNYRFDPDAITGDTNELDLATLSKTIYVNEGDIVASYSDNLFERDGSIYDLFGELITPPEVDDEAAQKRAGSYVRYESHDFIADRTGYPYLDETGRICILDSLKLDSSQVPSGQFLRSPVSLEISGDLSQVNIACLRALTIHGSIQDCSIYCEEDLIIDGDIISCKNPGIQVLGSLKLNSMRHSRVYVKQGIDFNSEILHSIVATDGNLTGSEDGSLIEGGLVQAAGNIDISRAGSSSGDETEIEIAISPFYRAMLMQMTKECVRLRDEGDEKALDDIRERISRCEVELDNQLNLFLKRPTDEKRTVTVHDEIYAKTLFRVLKHSYQIKSHQKGIYLVEKE
ncbi:MAG: FapA family protein [Candidatus Cloacimonadaceae bacterium]|jgi:uncharacterized protein (DUF342 family)|nr:FapA family protein [Candidatus Cloacimonadota bacterium]MDY0126774.1 FapA family protein [Candidatus Cloacimonadaceae bacterium]MCB5254244.1 FapA family protein [Candidatus Cloacimonadota bacterium]MCK9177525.1 FapA family protein [Candidatus Cloacimonadota bacterium]MCK9242899.1 FapA family protein [Candidatus Cloacimonadota bacterium]